VPLWRMECWSAGVIACLGWGWQAVEKPSIP
jgi:hypothetical protein